MPFTKRLLLLALVLVLAGAVVICLTPVMVADGIRLFVLWKSHQQGVKVEIGQIESPLFRPVVLHRIRITSTQPCPFRVAMEASKAELKLNLRALISGPGPRVIRGLSIDGLQGDVERVNAADDAPCQFDWRLLHNLLADELQLTNLNLRVTNGNTRVELRDVALSASEIEAGHFTARAIRLNTPWLRREFLDLRGATAWENDRLVVGALSLARGLDIETITADFSRLERKRIGFELNLDAFGGKLRASVATESREKGAVWDVAGTASEISLGQMSTALGLTEPATGSVHASKFTFRGGSQNLFHATASVWAEVTGFTWRDRRAETVMLGASLYNRQVDVEQLYVKQRTNQFTLSGEYALPPKSSDWVNPDFRADIFASIDDLGEFARLFGAAPDSFSGSIFISGTVNGRDRNIGGHIVVDGKSLRLFAMPADALSARMSLKGSQLNVEELQVQHGGNSIEATGTADLSRQHEYSGNLKGSIANMSDYWPLFPSRWQALEPEGDVSIEWNGKGNVNAHSGDFHLQGQGIHLISRPGLLPFDVQMNGVYTPKNVFFRALEFSNGHAHLGAFATVGPNYVQLQNLRFDLDGVPKLSGHVFLPFAFAQWMNGGETLAAIDRNQNFDLDLTLDSTDLAEFETALTGQSKMTGNLRGQLTVYHPLSALQSSFEAHLRDFGNDEPVRASVDLEGHIGSESLALNLSAITAGSAPMKLEATLPVQFKQADAHFFLDPDQPFSASFDFPTIALAKLPRNLASGIFRDGFLSGKLVATQSLKHPQVVGEVQVLNAKLVKAPGPVAGFAGRLAFNGSSASLDFGSIESSDSQLRLNGSIDFADTSRIQVSLIPESTVWKLTTLPNNACIGGINFFPARKTSSDHQTDQLFPVVEQIDLRGGLIAPWTLTLTDNGRPDSLGAPGPDSQTFSLCQPGGETLQLGFTATAKNEFGQDAGLILDGRKSLDRSSNSLPLP